LITFKKQNIKRNFAALKKVTHRKTRVIFWKNIYPNVASDGELIIAPQPPSPSPEGEGVQGMRLLNLNSYSTTI
jgi:hypothetical protein